MVTLPELLLIIACLIFMAAVVISWRKRIFDYTDLGLALVTAALFFGL